MITTWNTALGIGVIALMVLIASVWLLALLGETNNRYIGFLKKYSMHAGFLLSLGAVIGSLTYSEIFHLPPCTFCWWQRIFMYPQVIILATGIWFKEKRFWITSIILSIIGIAFSISHILLQAGIRHSTGACLESGVSCTKIDVLVFGWLTIPIMCGTLFVGILTFAYLAHRTEKTA